MSIEDSELTVSVLVPNRGVETVCVPSRSTTIQDVLGMILGRDGVRGDVLGGLLWGGGKEDEGWALQVVRKEKEGRIWEEVELASVGDDILPNDHLVSSLVAVSSSPLLRLVSLHPSLSATLIFARVPEIQEDFTLKVFFPYVCTVQVVVENVCERLGLVRVGRGKGGVVEYVIEVDMSGESRRLQNDDVLATVLQELNEQYGSKPSNYTIRFCVPEEWYLNPTARSPHVKAKRRGSAIFLSSSSDQSTNASSSEDKHDTAKQNKQAPVEAATPKQDKQDKRSSSVYGSFSAGRLSNLFEGWLGGGSSANVDSGEEASGTVTPKRMSVSEPVLVEGGVNVRDKDEGGGDGISEEAEFEKMITDLGLKGPQREAMYNLPAERRRYLIRQNQLFGKSQPQTLAASTSTSTPTSSSTKPSTPTSPSANASGQADVACRPDNHTPYPASVGPATSQAILSALGTGIVPQLTGDGGLFKRFSVGSWGSGGGGDETKSPTRDEEVRASWGWWGSSSSGDTTGEIVPTNREASSKTENRPESHSDILPSIEQYTTPLQSAISRGKFDGTLVKQLISLRVQLSTAKIGWVEVFVKDKRGMDVLSELLRVVVDDGIVDGGVGADAEGVFVMLETVKCLRVLFNTEIGFEEALESPTLITHIVYTLYFARASVSLAASTRHRLLQLVSSVLAAVCVLAVSRGHQRVLAAFSDYAVRFREQFRFEGLVDSLRVGGNANDDEDEHRAADDNHESAAAAEWESRTAVMTLVNAMTNCPEDLEERVRLREEFGRRGLNEVIVTLRYIRPPDALLTQIDVYTEEKFEDEEDMRARLKGDYSGSGTFATGGTLIRAWGDIEQTLAGGSETVEDLRESVVTLVERMREVLRCGMSSSDERCLTTLAGELIDCGMQSRNELDPDVFLSRFVSRAGQVLALDHPIEVAVNSKVKELNDLRTSVEKLSKERDTLQSQLSDQRIELDTLKSILPSPSSKPQQNLQGLIQRLVTKEKQVLRLQSEIEGLKSQIEKEMQELELLRQDRQDRDRSKWNALMGEIAELKAKNGELESRYKSTEKGFTELCDGVKTLVPILNAQTELRSPLSLLSGAAETLAAKNSIIESLREEVAKLRAKGGVTTQINLEKAFKRSVPPPPPPPPPVRRSTIATESVPVETIKQVALANASSRESIPGEQNDTLRVRRMEVVPASASTEAHLITPLPTPAPSPVPPTPPPPPPPIALSQSPTTISSVPVITSAPPPPPPLCPPPPAPAFRAQGSGAPPPPPPPPMPAIGDVVGKRPSAIITRSSRRLKPFFWSKVSGPSMNSTIWNDIAASSATTVDLNDLEEMFALDESNTRASVVSLHSPKKEMSTLLDINRANNISIMLSRIKLSPPDIKRALLALDDASLSVDDLRAIGKQMPTAEEVSRIKTFGDVSQLSRADQYFSEIMDIPRLPDRVECMVYRRKLDLEVEEIRPDLDIVREAAQELRVSTRLKQVLKTVLAVGNTLNASTFRGGALGFTMDTLLKLKETKTAKASSDCPTLLHYVARVLLRTDANIVNFLDELPHLEAAARVSMSTVSSSIATLQTGLERIHNEIRQSKNAKQLCSGDRFVEIMEPFVIQATPIVEETVRLDTTLNSEIRTMLAYFGEPNTSQEVKPEDFFGLIMSFSTSLQKAALEIHEMEKKSNAARALMQDTRSIFKHGLGLPLTSDPHLVVPLVSTQNVPEARTTTKYPFLSVGKGDVDEAIRSMRQGVRRTRNDRPLSKMFLDGTS